MDSAELAEYARRGVREIGRAGGKPGTGEGVIVGISDGTVTVKGEAVLDGGDQYQLMKLVVRAIEAAARWRGEQAGREARDA